MTEEDLEAAFPDVRWTRPVKVRSTGDLTDQRLACRYCICLVGLKGSEIHLLPKTVEEFEQHQREKHGRPT